MGWESNEKQAYHVSLITIIGNIILSAFKLFAGIFANSAAMVSDAVHSASDVFSTFIVIIGIKISAKESDKEHPYGHERYECAVAIILAVILAATGIGIGYSGVSSIITGNYAHMAVPGILALIAAVISIISKEVMYWYTRAAAKHINSGALMADAWHHRSDAMSSIGSLLGILGARLGFPLFDSIACLIICIFILKAALSIFIDSIKKMTDTACDDSLIESIHETILRQDGVICIDCLRTRLFGNKVYIDVDISTNGNVTLYEGHAVAEKVHDEIETLYPEVKHCMVHMNPCEGKVPVVKC